jgi:hypothetical protein
MKLGEMLDRLDSPIQPYFNDDALIEELGLSGWADLARHGFTSRAITVWNCTDTMVGRMAIYLDGLLVAINDQEARKCRACWEWTSREAHERVHARVAAALMDEHHPAINLIDRDGDANPTYQLEFADQVMWNNDHRYAHYRDREVEVLGPGNRGFLCESVRIRDGEAERVVNLEEIHFAVPLRPAGS